MDIFAKIIVICNTVINTAKVDKTKIAAEKKRSPTYRWATFSRAPRRHESAQRVIHNTYAFISSGSILVQDDAKSVPVRTAGVNVGYASILYIGTDILYTVHYGRFTVIRDCEWKGRYI